MLCQDGTFALQTWLQERNSVSKIKMPVPDFKHSPSEPWALHIVLPLWILMCKSPLAQEFKGRRILFLPLKVMAKTQSLLHELSIKEEGKDGHSTRLNALETLIWPLPLTVKIIQPTNVWDPAACRAVHLMLRNSSPALIKLTVYIQNQLA